MNFKRMWDKFSDLLGDTILHPQYFIKRAERETLIRSSGAAHGVFLDVGCGRQWYRGKIEPKVEKYYALDNPKTSKKYKSLFPVELKTDATRISLGDSTVDTAMMIMVLEHLPDPETALREIRRVLKKDGQLLMCTVENYPGHDSPYNYYHYTKFGLVELLKRNKFSVLKIQSFGNYFETVVVYQNVYLMQKIKKIGAIGLVLFVFLYPILIASNLFALVVGQKKVSEEFCLAHLVICEKRG